MLVPFIAGLVCLIIPTRVRYIKEAISIFASGTSAYFAVTIFVNRPYTWEFFGSPLFKIDDLSGFILLATGVFSFLVSLYSAKFISAQKYLNQYYSYLLWTLAVSYAVIMSNNLLALTVFWGASVLILYLLVRLGNDMALKAAKKAFVLVGGADCAMILSVGLIWYLTGTFQMDKIHLTINSTISTVAFLGLAIAAFAKAGVMPLHSWIPDVAENSPASISAYLPASLDKLLGIYLLGRLLLGMFVLNKAMTFLLLSIGAFTIVAAVMMALVQHDAKRLLGYHAVSQVGYMILGLGTGNPVGIIGALFHMLNNAIYKCCLFLTTGAVEYRTHTTDLSKLGGLGRSMSITFLSFAVASLAISGVPPLNGFASKWLIYQGLINLGREGDKLWFIWLAAAMFGSALTLASFMKLMHAIYLGQPSMEIKKEGQNLKEVHWSMYLPMVVLAGLCIAFGIFAKEIPLKFLLPISYFEKLDQIGIWDASLASALMLIGIACGVIIYFIFSVGKIRTDTTYIGGEVLASENRVAGTDFYNTVKEYPLLRGLYKRAEQKQLDVYDQGSKVIFYFDRLLRRVHTGVLPTYFFWALLGLAALVLFILYF